MKLILLLAISVMGADKMKHHKKHSNTNDSILGVESQSQINQWSWEAEQYRHNDSLIFALQTRVLTDSEMMEVQQAGYNLLVRYNEPFYTQEIESEFREILKTQGELRIFASQGGCR